jgi:hypothetical protein
MDKMYGLKPVPFKLTHYQKSEPHFAHDWRGFGA